MDNGGNLVPLEWSGLAPKYLENSPTDLLTVLHDWDWSGGILGLDPGYFESGWHMIIPRGWIHG